MVRFIGACLPGTAQLQTHMGTAGGWPLRASGKQGPSAKMIRIREMRDTVKPARCQYVPVSGFSENKFDSGTEGEISGQRDANK